MPKIAHKMEVLDGRRRPDAVMGARTHARTHIEVVVSVRIVRFESGSVGSQVFSSFLVEFIKCDMKVLREPTHTDRHTGPSLIATRVHSLNRPPSPPKKKTIYAREDEYIITQHSSNPIPQASNERPRDPPGSR